MTPEESIEAAYRLLRDNGFTNVEVRGQHPFWLVKTGEGTSATSDEPDNFWWPHECAEALVAAHRTVAPAPEPEQIAGHETDSTPLPQDAPAPLDDGLPESSGVGAVGEVLGGNGSGALDETDSEIVQEGAEASGHASSPQLHSDELSRDVPPHGTMDNELPQDDWSAGGGRLADVQEPVREEVGDAGAPEVPGAVDLGDGAAPEGSDGRPEDGAAMGGSNLFSFDGPSRQGAGDDEVVLDADYADIAADAGDPLGLPAPDDGVIAVEGADIEQLLLEDGSEDLGAEILDEAEPQSFSEPNRFYGLDDLDRRRSLRIGDVNRYALSISPEWTAVHDAKLVELRNFAMGVAEGRWPNNPETEAELNELEAMLGRLNAISAELRRKVGFLNEATRDEVEAFVVEQGWP